MLGAGGDKDFVKYFTYKVNRDTDWLAPSEFDQFLSCIMPHDSLRFTQANDLPVQADRRWVVYWMTATRRMRSNFALQRARDWAKELGKPLVVLEALRIRYRWASDRLHRFVIEGMVDNQNDFAETVAHYYPYVEPEPGCGSG